MIYYPKDIATICKADLIQETYSNLKVKDVLIDSRSYPINAKNQLFFAIKGDHLDGHQYIQDIYNKGVRSFVIEDSTISFPEDANIYLVEDTLTAFQDLCFTHRQQFDFPVIGITGSNGKTIIKEWLYFLLQDHFELVKSPKSYNSKIGVPLSIKQFQKEHNLGLIEVGISQPGEMDLHQKIVHPSIGIFCHLGAAHQQNFKSYEQKIQEKLKLFSGCESIIYNADEELLNKLVLQTYPTASHFAWSIKNVDSSIFVEDIQMKYPNTEITLLHKNERYSIRIPFIDKPSIENAIYCFCLLASKDLLIPSILDRFGTLSNIDMRLQLHAGIHRCQIINDSYTNDATALEAALNYLNQFKAKKSIVLSDFTEIAEAEADFYQKVGQQISALQLDKFIGIGEKLKKYKSYFPSNSVFFSSSEIFIKDFDFNEFNQETILVKGSRKFKLEEITNRLKEKIHLTRLEINLNSLRDNLNFYRSNLPKDIKIMAMVKAFSYGAGSVEIAQELAYNRVDYLAVAYLSEGVALRNAGIKLPILVLNSRVEQIEQMIRYSLEPEIFSLELLVAWEKALDDSHLSSRYPIHIKLDTGMNRLGFDLNELNTLSNQLKQVKNLKVASVLSHLASSDDLSDTAFNLEQIHLFKSACLHIEQSIGYSFIRHILNSAGALNYPEGYADMVRLGIGLYGIENSPKSHRKLKAVSKLISHISQIRKVPKGDSVGYNRQHIAQKDMTIAIIPVGYADGLMRCLSNGVGQVLITGKPCPIIGSICMDMTMVDITEISAKAHDEVILFGPEWPIEKLAKSANTIPYEILTGISERVPRVYIKE